MSENNYLDYVQEVLAEHHLSSDFEDTDQSRGRNNILVDELHDLRIERVLDIGCGTGMHLLPFAKRKKATCFGIDLGLEVSRVGKLVFADADVENLGIFLPASGEEIPFQADSFDVVICYLALPYMDADKVFPEIARVLRSSGVVYLKIHSPYFYFWMLKERLSSLNPKKILYPVLCLMASASKHLFGTLPPGSFWQGKEVFETYTSLVKKLDANKLHIAKELPDSCREAPSFVIKNNNAILD